MVEPPQANMQRQPRQASRSFYVLTTLSQNVILHEACLFKQNTPGSCHHLIYSSWPINHEYQFPQIRHGSEAVLRGVREGVSSLEATISLRKEALISFSGHKQGQKLGSMATLCNHAQGCQGLTLS